MNFVSKASCLLVILCCLSSNVGAFELRVYNEELVRVPAADLPKITERAIGVRYPVEKADMAGLKLDSSFDLRELSSIYGKMFNVYIKIFICGLKEKWSTFGRLYEYDRPRRYIALMPLKLQDQVFSGEDGRTRRGWPEALVRENGICFQIGAGSMLGIGIYSNTVRIPGDGRGVLW